MAELRGRDRMVFDFLAVGRSFGLSVWQTQRLWERLIRDSRYYAASDPNRWLDATFRREAAAIVAARDPQGEAAASPYPFAVGKRTLVEEERNPTLPITKIGHRTLVDEVYGRGRRHDSTSDRRPRSEKVSFEDCQTAALRDVCLWLRDHHELNSATIAAAEPHVAQRMIEFSYPRYRFPLPSHPTPQGQAMWGAANARAVTLYRQAQAGGRAAAAGPEVVEALAKIGSGVPLPDEVRKRMEEIVGASLVRVRLHTGPIAAAACQAVDAEAFTVANDVFYPRFDPASVESLKTLAHECVHVTQWQGGRVPTAKGAPTVSRTSDPLELEAEQVVARAFSTPIAVGGTQRCERRTKTRYSSTRAGRICRAKTTSPARS